MHVLILFYELFLQNALTDYMLSDVYKSFDIESHLQVVIKTTSFLSTIICRVYCMVICYYTTSEHRRFNDTV